MPNQVSEEEKQAVIDQNGNNDIEIQMPEAQLEEIKENPNENEYHIQEQISEGSHGELISDDLNENISESIPDHFPWQVEYRSNYIRQQGLT